MSDVNTPAPDAEADPAPEEAQQFEDDLSALQQERDDLLDTTRRLHEAAAKGLAKRETREKIAAQGMDATPSASPEAFEAELRAEAPMWRELVRESGAKIE